MRAKIEVVIADAHLGIWQDNPNDKSCYSDVFGPLIHRLRSRGWSLRADKETRRHHPILSPMTRAGAKGALRCEIRICGRHIEINFWSCNAVQSNRNGRKYDFNRMQRMPAMDQRRVELEYRHILGWLETIAPVSVARRDERRLAPMAKIEKSYAESWHSDKQLKRPICKIDANRTTRDGALLEHGQTVYFADDKGRILKGAAYYNINNMWWIIAGSELRNKACFEIWANPPSELRAKRNEKLRRGRLEAQLSIAINKMDFLRAHTLKQILFGDQQAYLIWSRDRGAYYGPLYAGYFTDRSQAGKYTRAEAEKECRRCPDALEMVDPDGKHICFERKAG